MWILLFYGIIFLFGGLLYLLGVIFLSVSVWILIFQSILYVLIFFILFFSIKGKEINLKINFKSFLNSYLILDVCVEILFILSYFFRWDLGLSVLGIFKLGVSPFFYYKYFLKGLNFKYFYVRFFVFIYFLISKAWSLILLKLFLFNYYNLGVLSLFMFVTIVINWEGELNNFIFKSLIFSNFIILIMNIDFYLIIFYVVLSSFIQFKILFSNQVNIFFEDFLKSIFYLTILNGNLLFSFNFLKTLILINLFEGLSFLFGFLLSLISFTLLFFSLNIFIREFITSRLSNICIYILILITYVVLIISWSSLGFSFEYLLFEKLYFGFIEGIFDLRLESKIIFLKNLIVEGIKESSDVTKEFVINYILELGVGLFILGVVIGIKKDFLDDWEVNNTFLIKIEEIFNILIFKRFKKLNKFYLKGFNSLIVPISIISLPFISVCISSNNSNILYLEEEKGRSYKKWVYLQIVAFQWGWNLSLLWLSPILDISILYPAHHDIVLFVGECLYGGKDFSKSISFYTKSLFGREEENFPIPCDSFISIRSNSIDVLHALSSMNLGFKVDIDKGTSLESFINIFEESGREFDFNCYEFCGYDHSNMSGRFIVASNLDLNFISF